MKLTPLQESLSLEEIRIQILTIEEEDEASIEERTMEKWGVYVDPETGKMVSKDIPKSESLNTITSCGKN